MSGTAGLSPEDALRALQLRHELAPLPPSVELTFTRGSIEATYRWGELLGYLQEDTLPGVAARIEKALSYGGRELPTDRQEKPWDSSRNTSESKAD